MENMGNQQNDKWTRLRHWIGWNGLNSSWTKMYQIMQQGTASWVINSTFKCGENEIPHRSDKMFSCKCFILHFFWYLFQKRCQRQSACLLVGIFLRISLGTEILTQLQIQREKGGWPLALPQILRTGVTGKKFLDHRAKPKHLCPQQFWQLKGWAKLRSSWKTNDLDFWEFPPTMLKSEWWSMMWIMWSETFTREKLWILHGWTEVEYLMDPQICDLLLALTALSNLGAFENEPPRIPYGDRSKTIKHLKPPGWLPMNPSYFGVKTQVPGFSLIYGNGWFFNGWSGVFLEFSGNYQSRKYPGWAVVARVNSQRKRRTSAVTYCRWGYLNRRTSCLDGPFPLIFLSWTCWESRRWSHFAYCPIQIIHVIIVLKFIKKSLNCCQKWNNDIVT